MLFSASPVKRNELVTLGISDLGARAVHSNKKSHCSVLSIFGRKSLLAFIFQAEGGPCH